MSGVLRNIWQSLKKTVSAPRTGGVPGDAAVQDMELTDMVKKNAVSVAETMRMDAFEEMMSGLLTEKAGGGCLMLLSFDEYEITTDILENTEAVLKEIFKECAVLGKSDAEGFALWLPAYACTEKNNAYLRKHTAEANDRLLHPGKDITPVTLSAGVVFCGRDNGGETYKRLHKNALTALRRVKESGGCGCEFFEISA